jgi:hypothetical protein
MKTAMQELIEILEDKNHLSNPRNNQDDIDTYLHCIDEAKELLEKEKEQICNAYSDGAKGGANGTKGQHEFGFVSIQIKEEYYNQTYKK